MSVSEVVDVGDEERAGGWWWTVDPLLMQPHEGKVRLLSPKATKRLIVTADIAQFLITAQKGHPRELAVPPYGWSIRHYRSVSTMLASYGFLVSDLTPTEAATPWRHWGPLAWAYHDTTTNPSTADLSVAAEPSEVSPPSSFSRWPDQSILLLPRLSPRTGKSFIDVLEQRRTHRDFLADPVSVEAFSDILRYSFGPLRYADGGRLGVMQLRAAAAGGARHETEAYVYVFAVNGVRPGLYAYDGLRHGLALVRQGELRGEIENLTLDQGFFRQAAFGVLTVALSDRMSWKYQHASAYRVMWQNVGHLAQVFSMMCASLDLGAALTGAIRGRDARACLGLRAESEIVTFAMACGRPELAGDGLPTSTRPPDAPFAT